LEETRAQTKFKSCITVTSVLALIYATLIFMPAAIWTNLVIVGVNLSTIDFATLLIVVELSRLTGKKLTKQEMIVIWALSWMAISSPWLGYIYRAYYVQSPLVPKLGIDPMLIPTWWAPPITANVFRLRTFLHPSWVYPIAIAMVEFACGQAMGLFCGIIARDIFVRGEKLPFPLQLIKVQAVTSLSERKKIHLLAIPAFISFIYGLFLYTIPFTSRVLGYPIELIPFPWYDFTKQIERILPGACIGISTDAMLISSGLFLPSEIVVTMLIGSLISFMIVNPLLVRMHLTAWAERWTYGMSIQKIYQDSILYFWLSIFIGISIAVGIVPLILHPKPFIRTLKSFRSPKFMQELEFGGDELFASPRKKLALMTTLFIIGMVGNTALDWYLAPDFPLWAIALINIPVPLMFMIVNTRFSGLTGLRSFNIPYLKELTIISTGYQDMAAWFLPLDIWTGVGWAENFKICDLTETKSSSYIKLWLIMTPITLLIGFIYTQMFWTIAPIPSSMYPAPAYIWPINIVTTASWIKRPPHLFHVDWILYSFFIFAGLIALIDFFHLPISLIGLSAGLMSLPPPQITQFIGLVIGKILTKKFGKSWFNRNKAIIAAGIGLGEGLAIVLATGISIIYTGAWMRPF